MNEAEKIKVLIVDDEPLARDRIRDILKNDEEVEIIGECGNGRGTVKAVQENPPDLIFLDIQMPEMDGFAVLDAIKEESQMPFVVFVTAYDRYAVRAFEVFALDYILKPYDKERFEKALQRAKTQIQLERSREMNQRIYTMLEELKNGSAYLKRIAIRTEGHVSFIKTEEIDWIEAEGNYVCIHFGKDSHLLREAIGTLEAKLDPKKFLRIHRSAIVNLESVRELQSWFHGDYRVILNNGTELTLSRNYREKLRDILGRYL